MRIIYVTTALPYTAKEAFIIPEIKALLRRGHEVCIVPRSPGRTVVHEDARPLVRRSCAQPLFSARIARGALAGFRQEPGRSLEAFRRVGQSGGSDALLKNLAVFPKGLWLAQKAREWNAAHIHAHWGTTTATMAMIAGELSGIPWSFTAHRFDIVANNLLAQKVQKASFVRFICRKGLEMARELGIEGLEEKARVIHMGVDLPAAAGAHQPVDPFVLLCPANLVPVKGHEYLIEAIRILEERRVRVPLYLAGQGELRERLQSLVAQCGLAERVRFLGQLSHADLLGAYDRGEVGAVVLPSIDLGNGEHEGLPVALIEAMNYGIPVISTTTGGIPELLGEGAGLLVPPQDPMALAEAIERLRADRELRQQLGEAGRRRVVEGFAMERVIEDLILHFQSEMGRLPGVEVAGQAASLPPSGRSAPAQR
jgi:glycosyltransferase involved in cell wall biosynthesis